MSNQDILDNLTGTEVAIVGMAARLPGANDVEQYWQNLRNGVESVQFYNDDELRAAGVDESMLRNPDYVKASAPLDEMDMFDAAFFGFGPREAAILDPQHRHFLEVAWEALEHAGYDPRRYPGSIGIWGGSGHNAYMPYNLLTNPQLIQSMGMFLIRHTGNDKDFLTTRVSYLLNLRGPSVNVQTACSTSLVAAHLAAQALINGECDMALAGGVTIEQPHHQGYLYREDEVLSPDGHCRAFDVASKGTVFGSGAGVVVLKRLEDAILDGDTIHALIKGSAVNNDGSTKISYFAPSVDGQANVIAEAISIAGVEADTVTYVEAHGTGTQLGDPIELAALTQAFRETTDQTGYCGIGSAKTNIGHLDTAAGVAGLIKLTQALRYKEIPPSLNFESPNPAIDFEHSPFFVNDTLRPWQANGMPRRAGLSSLGVGGTNAHLVLEEAPQLDPSSESRSWQLLMLSARTETALDAATTRLADFLRNAPDTNLADLAYTYQVGRHPLERRRVVAVHNQGDAVVALADMDRQRVFSSKYDGPQPSTIFMFPGGGAQYPNMGRDLYDEEPLYREVVDECLQIVSRYSTIDLHSLMFPAADADLDDTAQRLQPTEAALPAIFIAEYALARLWLSWGVQPAAMIGHSLGEYTAACLAGVMTLDDALRLVVLRGQLMETMPEGAVLSVPLAEDELKAILPDNLSLAVVNGPELCAVSGDVPAIDAFERYLLEQEIEVRRLRLSVAAHSHMLDPILDDFYAGVAQVNLQPPQMPYISNMTGDWITPEEATDPHYWVRHLRHTVRFGDGVATLLDGSSRILLEVGPGTTLTSLARLQGGPMTALASLRHPREEVSDLQFILTTLGRLWMGGQDIDWDAFYAAEIRHRVPAPTYAFDHQPFWIDPGQQMFTSGGGEVALGHLDNLDNWFYRPTWQPVRLSPPVAADDEQAEQNQTRWLIFLDGDGLGETMAAQLRRDGDAVVTVRQGAGFKKLGDDAYALNSGQRDDYGNLIGELDERLPHRIVHLWAVGDAKRRSTTLSRYENGQNAHFFSLIYLAQALGNEVLPHPIRLGVIADGMQDVMGEGLPWPEKAILMGPCKVIPREIPEVTCQSIDVQVTRRGGPQGLSADRLATQLIAELNAPEADSVVAYRGTMRWVRQYEPAPPQATEENQNRLRENGVYLITGGVGGIGLTIAEHLADTAAAKLVLTSRRGLPDESQWDQWLETRPEQDKTSQQIRKVRHLQALGAEVLVLPADVTSRQQMQAVITQARTRFGHINGVIHGAGLIDDGLIQEKTPESAATVMNPKVIGALLLDDLLANEPLDFMVLFSSTSTALGPAGQVDYVAANAFLDAYAHSKVAQGDPYTVTINWGVWSEVGMAVAAATGGQSASQATFGGVEAGHPLLGQRIVETDAQITYSADYDVEHFWLLDEHRLSDGTALIPGTGYLEIAQAALTASSKPTGAVQIDDLFFLRPLDVGDEETRNVRVTLDKNGKGYHLTVAAQVGEGWQENVLGKVSYSDMPAPGVRDIDEIRARCTVSERVLSENDLSTKQEERLLFGPRWKNLKHVWLGETEGLALLELSDSFHGDLADYAIHPSLLDIATSFGLSLVADYETRDDFYVPMSYKRVRLYKPVPARIWSHVRYLGDGSANTDVAAFDVTIMDEQGTVVAEIDEFMVKQVSGDVSFVSERGTQAAEPATPAAGPGAFLLELALTDGIQPEEGAEAFARILAGGGDEPQMIASSLDLQALIAHMSATGPADGDDAGILLSRPELGSDYIAPRNPIEVQLAAIWSKLLGIEQVGIHDDFFDLGGYSLIAMRLFAQIRKAWNVDFALSTLFEARTIADLAGLIAAEVGGFGDEAGDDVPVARQKKRQSLLVQVNKGDARRPKLFCVHDLNGHVLYYRDLVRHLGDDQPFYALQAKGVDGKEPLDTRIEDMADRYLSEIREAQPEGPYYLGGSSLGGLVAFDMAQKLLAQGDEVALLAMMDSWSPAYMDILFSGPQERPLAERAAGHWEQLRQRGPAYIAERIRSRIGWAQYKVEANRLKAMRAITSIYVQRGLPMPPFVRDFHREEVYGNAYRSYEAQPYPGKMTLFKAINRLEGDDFDVTIGWGDIALGGVEIHNSPGPHGFMVRDPYAQVLAEQLRSAIDHARSQPRPRTERLAETMQ